MTPTDPNLTSWRDGVEGGAGYSWPRNGLVSVSCLFCTSSNAGRWLHSIMEAVDTTWTCSGLYPPVHTPYIFFLALYGLIFYQFRALSTHAAKENDCRLATSHEQGTRDFSGGIMDTLFHVSHLHTFFQLSPHHIRHITLSIRHRDSSCTL